MNKDAFKKVASALDKMANFGKSAVVVISAAKVLVDSISDLANKIR